MVKNDSLRRGWLNWIRQVKRKANETHMEASVAHELLALFHSRSIVDITGFAHLPDISGPGQVTGFQGLSFCGNDLKQPISAQVDDAVCEAPPMLSQRPDLILPVIRSSRRLRNGSPLAGLSLSAPIPALE